MKIENIEKDRIEKIRSLLTNKANYEINLLKSEFCKEYPEEKKITQLIAVIDSLRSLDYGDHPLHKYYFVHPVRVARLCVNWLKEIDDNHFEMIMSALIHNALEMNILSSTKLEQEYSSWTRETIEVITVDRKAQKMPGWAQKYYGNILSLDKYGQMLKVFDKFDNIYALCLNPDKEIRNSYLGEIEKYIQPTLDKFAPHLSNYFTMLVASTRRYGYKSPEQFISEFENGIES